MTIRAEFTSLNILCGRFSFIIDIAHSGHEVGIIFNFVVVRVTAREDIFVI